MGLRACIRAVRLCSNATDFLKRIRAIAEKPVNRAYTALLHHDLSLAFDKKNCSQQATECFDEMASTLASFGTAPEMLTELYSHVTEAFLRFRGSLPSDVTSPFSCDQLTRIVDVVEQNLGLFAPVQRQEVYARLVGFISRLPMPDLYIPLARLLSVIAATNPRGTREAYDVLRHAVR
jgi:hypothetical protein